MCACMYMYYAYMHAMYTFQYLFFHFGRGIISAVFHLGPYNRPLFSSWGGFLCNCYHYEPSVLLTASALLSASLFILPWASHVSGWLPCPPRVGKNSTQEPKKAQRLTGGVDILWLLCNSKKIHHAIQLFSRLQQKGSAVRFAFKVFYAIRHYTFLY